MFFAAPWWLMGLLPWAGVVLWLLRGQRDRVAVPFLPLWHGQAPLPSRRRAIVPPPLALAAALLAMLLAIVAAARPTLFWGQGGAVTVIADRGLTMSIQSNDGKSRLSAAAELADSTLSDAGHSPVDLQVVPAATLGRGDWLEQVRGLAPTAALDPPSIARAARAALRDSGGAVIVLSDQAIGLADDRMVQIAPPSPPLNVGIDVLSVRQTPRVQMMVRVVNQSSLQQARLIARGGQLQITQHIALPPAGQSRNYFMDLPAAWPVVEAQISANDGEAPNHRAWAIRQRAWPHVEAGAVLTPPLQRMIEVYSHDRPASAESKTVTVVDAATPPPTDSPAAIVADAGATVLEKTEPLQIAQAPLDLEDVNWAKVLDGAKVAAPPAGDWTPLVSVDGTVLVAARSQPLRQVWVGFTSSQFPRTADFVIFWKDVLDWLGEGQSNYTSSPVGPLVGRWQLQEPAGAAIAPTDAGLLPGVYAGPDGSLQAVNAGTAAAAGGSTPDWPAKLRTLLDRSGQRPHELCGLLLILALGLLCVSAATWVRRRDVRMPSEVPLGR
jgi:hypothetical protein